MTLPHEEWKKVLDAVKSNKDRIFEQIKERFKQTHKGMFQKWEQKGFDMRYLFDRLYDIDHTKKVPLLHICFYNQQLEMIKLLLEEKGANVNEKDSSGNTPLYLAALFGNKEILITLLERGGNVNEKDSLGITLLHSAVLSNIIS